VCTANASSQHTTQFKIHPIVLLNTGDNKWTRHPKHSAAVIPSRERKNSTQMWRLEIVTLASAKQKPIKKKK